MKIYNPIILVALVAFGISCGARPSLDVGGGGSGATPPCETDDDCGPGSPCAGHDACIEQTCYPGPGVDLLDDEQCTNDVCDLATGAITHPPVDVDDGNACTLDGCTEGVGIWHTRVDAPVCNLAVDCYYFPTDTEIAGRPCVNNDDCLTHNLCITSTCDALSLTCQILFKEVGTGCSMGGTCDGDARCCLPL